MYIRWLGQSGYQLKSGDSEIIIDPYLSDIVGRLHGRPRLVPPAIDPQMIHADAVVCTHNHLDHLDTDAVANMPDTQFFVSTGEGCDVLKSMGKTNVQMLSVGQSTKVGSFQITAVFAEHTCEAFGLVVEAEDIRLYFSADTLFSGKLFHVATYKPDIAFICINGKLGNMDYLHAAIVAQRIGAPINIPNHYGMFASNTENPENFTALVPNSMYLEYGQDYTITKSADIVSLREM